MYWLCRPVSCYWHCAICVIFFFFFVWTRYVWNQVLNWIELNYYIILQTAMLAWWMRSACRLWVAGPAARWSAVPTWTRRRRAYVRASSAESGRRCGRRRDTRSRSGWRRCEPTEAPTCTEQPRVCTYSGMTSRRNSTKIHNLPQLTARRRRLRSMFDLRHAQSSRRYFDRTYCNQRMRFLFAKLALCVPPFCHFAAVQCGISSWSQTLLIDHIDIIDIDI